MSTQTQTQTHCVHLHTNPKQARAAIRESGTIVHYCAPCAADTLVSQLQHNGPAGVARSVDFKHCSHIGRDARRCLICCYGVTGALLMLWSIVRLQTEGSNAEANRLLRLLQAVGLYHGPAFGRLGIQCGALWGASEEAILPVGRLERR